MLGKGQTCDKEFNKRGRWDGSRDIAFPAGVWNGAYKWQMEEYCYTLINFASHPILLFIYIYIKMSMTFLFVSFSLKKKSWEESSLMENSCKLRITWKYRTAFVLKRESIICDHFLRKSSPKGCGCVMQTCDLQPQRCWRDLWCSQVRSIPGVMCAHRCVLFVGWSMQTVLQEKITCSKCHLLHWVKVEVASDTPKKSSIFFRSVLLQLLPNLHPVLFAHGYHAQQMEIWL